MRFSFRHLAGIGILALATDAAAAELITGNDTGRILEIAKSFGTAELSTDSGGDPKISGRMGGVKYTILFYGCTDGKDCQTIQFYSGWKTDKGAVSIERVNEWNRDNRFSKSYIDKEGDPALEMDVSLEHGVPFGNLDEWFAMWEISVTSFKEEIVN